MCSREVISLVASALSVTADVVELLEIDATKESVRGGANKLENCGDEDTAMGVAS